MNIKEWGKACTEGLAPRRYDNASREIQLSLKWNVFQSIFFSIRKLFIRSLFYEQYK